MNEYIEQDNDPKKDELTLYILGLIIMVVFLLSSCTTTKYVPVEKVITKDSLVIQKDYDSIYIKVKEVVALLRKMSPVWDKLQKGEIKHVI